MALKRTKLDRVFSDLVRERAEWTCERCETFYPEGRRQGLDCSHLFSRRHRNTRWHPDNAFAHCRGCHQYLGGNPVEFAGWAKHQLGEARFEDVSRRHHMTVKYTKADLEEMYIHYKAQLEYMRKRRANGEKGYIDFVSWD